jgi:hypothetical protein
VAGGVDQVDPVTVPCAADCRGEDGDPAIAFLRVEVGDGGAVMDLATFVGRSGDIKNPFGDSGFARVDVGENAQIPDGGQGVGMSVLQVVAHGTGPFRGDWVLQVARCA